MDKTLSNIRTIVDTYNAMDVLDGHELNYLIKDLTANLFYLEEIRSKYHDQYEGIIHKLVSEGKTVSRAKNEANVKVKEMYLIRRVMDAGYRISDAMRTNISYLKTEKHNS